MKIYEQTRLGPGSNEPQYNLVERRTNNVPKLHKPYYSSEDKIDDHEGDNLYLMPELPKRNRLVVKYMKKTEHFPAHTPDNVLNPGQWVYYNIDLDAVRETL